MEPWNKDFWNDLYKVGDNGWDIGYISPPLEKYFKRMSDKSAGILIPGCGNAHEGEYLINNGFENTWILDWSPMAVQGFQNRVPIFPKDQVICCDFFAHCGSYDFIFEQTFFCAIDPELREKYVSHVHQLLKPAGKLVGLLFNDPLNVDHPPFGGSEKEYRTLFQNHFKFLNFSNCYNSIEPRRDREFFINFEKK